MDLRFAYDVGVLEIASDDPQGRRLVLRARRAGVLFYLRRVAVTALAIAIPSLVVGARDIGWDDVLVAIGIGCALLLLPRSELSEVRVDGAAGAIVLRARGWACWFMRTHTLAVDSGVILEGGLPTPEPGRGAELGLALCTAGRGSGRERLELAIAGLDRRDELRRFVAVLADRLDVGMEVVADDALTYRARLAPGLPPAERAPHVGGAYRTASRVSPLETSTPPSFEEPRDAPPAFRLEASGEIADVVERFEPGAGRFAARQPARRSMLAFRPSAKTIRRWVVASAITSAGCAAAAAVFDGPIGSAALVGAALPTFVVAATTLGLVAGMFWLGALWIALEAAVTVVRGRGPSRPGGLADIEPRAWSIDGEVLEVRGRLWRRRFSLGKATLLVVRRESSSQGQRYSLWLRVGARWVRLVATRWLAAKDPAAALPGLTAFACALGRALDVPLRYAP